MCVASPRMTKPSAARWACHACVETCVSGSAHRNGVSRDIGMGCVGSSAWRSSPGGGGFDADRCRNAALPSPPCSRVPLRVEAARTYNVSQGWISRLMARYRVEGEAAFEPRSRRPHTSPNATAPETVELVLRLRKELTEQGHDAGADTIGWHLLHHHQTQLPRATIHRILVRNSAVVPDPSKRPKASYVRFEAEQPNETWQSDFTHYRLTGPDGTVGVDVEILTWLDDHSRYALHISVHVRVTGPIVLAAFRETAAQHGYPASVLTDNGMVYTTRFSGGRGGRNHLEFELRRAQHRAEELPAQPPHHLRQGRTLPADPQEVAARPARPADHHRRTPGPAGPVRSRVQPPPARTAPCPTTPPRPRPTPPAPKQSPPPTGPQTPTTESAPTRSARTAPSPCAWPANCGTSASAEPTPEPTSCSLSKTSLSASSTPPPARSSANSSSTPPATTRAPAGHPARHRKGNEPEPTIRRFELCRCPATSHRGAGGNRTRVLERRTRSSPGAVSDVVFSAPALALTRRRQAQSGNSPGHPS